MNRHHALLLLCCAMLFAAGCEQTSVAQQEQIRNLQTIQAGTPTTTPTATATATTTPTPTLTPTVGPTSTPKPTLPPTPMPPPPTPTPNPDLKAFSLCNQTTSATASGRFSARITTITTTVEPSFERLTIGLDVPGDSAAPYAMAHCLSAMDDEAQRGVVGANSVGYVLLLDLDGWLHDDRFKASLISPTTTLSGTEVLKNIAYRYDPNADAGATLAIGIGQPLPFRVELASAPPRLILEVAKTTTIAPASDALSLLTQGDAKPAEELFYLKDGDVWSSINGNLTKSPEIETALAHSAQAKRIAFCRAVAGADPGAGLAPSTLWTAASDGSNPVEVAAVGRACTDPTFAPDGKTIAFGVDETGAIPARISIYTVGVDGSALTRISQPSDEWSRFSPQWLGNDRLVYAARAEDGRSTLFVKSGDKETDIGAELVKGDRYRAVGAPIVAPDGASIAVEGWRAAKPGADLVLLDANGAEQGTLGGDAYWSRPVGWGADGTLLYLSSACASDVAQEYALHARKGSDDRVLAAGTSLGGFGQFVVASNGLAYITYAHSPAAPRGPLAIDTTSASALWFWDIGNGARVKLAESSQAILGMTP